MIAASHRSCLLFLLLLPILSACQQQQLPPLPNDQLQQIGQLIYQNECASKPRLLTSWNRGEAFASLGIGHFIWYPKNTPADQRPFHESFPDLLSFLREHGVALPAWLNAEQGAPWENRDQFLLALNSYRLQNLRQLLVATIPLQARFMQQRMLSSLTAMQAGLSDTDQQHLRQQFFRIATSPMGYYALIDYVNFKGEGISPTERYQGHGWGLRQVLLSMQGDQAGITAIDAFASSASKLLEQRVHLAPPGRHEQRWLPGWKKRLQTYSMQARRAVAARS